MYYKMIEKNLKDMLRKFGEDIVIDGVAGKALIEDTNVSVSTDFDDKKITTLLDIKRGSIVTYKNNSYLSIANVGTKKHNVYYEAYIRRCDHKLRFISPYLNFETIGFVDTRSTGQTQDGLVVLPSHQVIVTIPVGMYTDQLVKDFTVKFAIMGSNYAPKAYDQTKSGLIVIDAQLVV